MTTQAVSSGENTGVFMNKTALWAGVAIIGIVSGCVTFLAAIKADTTVILTITGSVIVPILAALGWGELKANRQATENVRQQTNGNYTQAMDMVREQIAQQTSLLQQFLAALPQKPPPPSEPEAPQQSP